MWLASFCFQKVQQPKILSPLAKAVADTPVNLCSEGFRCPSFIWVEPVRVAILEFPIRSTRKKDECVILKFYPLAMGPNFHKFTVSGSARSRRQGGGTINLVENSQLVKILSFRSYGLVGFILFPKSLTAQDSESSS